jgi:3-oxoacyl-[acyl-carrier protein] reductase
MSAFRVDGKVALVTGARPGIGGAAAVCLAEAGATVVLANRTVEPVEALAAQLRGRGLSAQAIGFAADAAGCARAVADTLALAGALDIVVHNAGGCRWTALDAMTAEVLDDALALNLKSCFWLTQAALPAFERRGGGRIVVTSSITGPRVAMREAAHYAAAKAGVNGFIRAAALELAPRRITVNGIEPGFVAKERGRLSAPGTRERVERWIPLGRAGRPEDIAHAMLFLASDEAAWITGQTIVVDGGATLPETGYAMAPQWQREEGGT